MCRRPLLLGLALLVAVPSLARAQRGGFSGHGGFSGGFRGHGFGGHGFDGRFRDHGKDGFLLQIGAGRFVTPVGFAVGAGVVLPPWGPGTGFDRGIDRRSVAIVKRGFGRDRLLRKHGLVRRPRFGVFGPFGVDGVVAFDGVGCDCVLTDAELVAEPVTYGVTTNIATAPYVLPARADTTALLADGRRHTRSQVTEIVYGARGGKTFRTVTRFGDTPAPERSRRR
ncbi:MAG TPA: hypothetical protein VFQ38_24380 [Longimicrobiales bacterium]|nr:hypothetical protein [Longimicrobiales bacterium]